MRILRFTIILTLLVSCEEKQVDIQEVIYGDVINDTYLQLTRDFKNLSDKNEILVNKLNDHLDSIMVLRAKANETWKNDSQKMYLIERLEKILNEPVTVNLKKLTAGERFQLIDDKTELDTFDFDRKSLAGLSTLSRVALDANQENGIFYVDFQFGNASGHGGFFVFVNKPKDKWTIGDIWKVW